MAENRHPTTFKIDPTIFNRFPKVQIGVVLALGIDNRGEREEITDVLSVEEDRVATDFNFIGTQASDHPNIAPIENLVGRVLRGNRIRHINKLVDIYNAISLRYVIPVGGEDLDTMQGNILLTIASDNEVPVVLLGEEEARPPQPGEVIYKDSVGAICRRWNWKEADRTKLTEQTSNAILVIEALPPVDANLLKLATNDLAGMVARWCGGRIETALLNAQRPELDLSK